MIPTLSIIFMAVSILISVGVPLGLFFGLRRKYELKVVPMLVGAAAFIVFALMLEQALHMIVLRPAADGSIALRTTNPALYALYGIFAAGIFEESARFISFKLLKKKYQGIGTGLAYGIGHGGIEAVLIVGLAMVSNIVISILSNTGSGDVIADAAQQIANIQPYMFLVSGLERAFAIVIQVSLSLIVWYSVQRKDKWWLFPAAILLHAAVDVPAVLSQIGVLENIWLVEGIVALSAVVLAWLAVFICKKLKD